MNRAIKNYLVLQFISLLIIYTVFNAIYYFNSSVASETITSHIRNDLIIRDFKSVQFNLNFSKNSGFGLVEVFDENMKRILAISEPDQPIWTKIIRKEIYVNPTIKTPQYVLFFYYDLIKPLMFSVVGLVVFSILTIPYVIIENKRLRKELEEEKVKFKNDEIRKMALQVFHDIRSPLAALKSVVPELADGEGFEAKVLKKSIEQMNHMAEALLAKSRGEDQSFKENFDLLESIKMLVDIKNVSLKRNAISLAMNTNKNGHLVANKHDFERMMSNLLNNAIESRKDSFVLVSIEVNGLKAFVKIEDNGNGIPEHILKNIGKEGVTNKVGGNGLGIMHAKNVLEDLGSKLEIETSSNGTKISFNLLLVEDDSSSNKVILIDDDELTRMIWNNKAQKQGIDLTCYKNVDGFMNEVENINTETTIYIDNHIGDLSGVELAEKLNKLGFKKLYMATGSNPNDFVGLKFLKGVIGKEPPF